MRMRLLNLLKVCFPIMSLLLVFSASAQTLPADSSLYASQLYNAITVYHQFLKQETGLYNGPQYVDYAYTIQEGIPFFMSADFTTGSLVYDNVLYENVPMLYDEVKDEVVIYDPYIINKIALTSEKMNAFTVINHHFVRIVEDSIKKNSVRTGFYDELYGGHTSIYKKQRKTIQENVSQGITRYIEETNNYYLKKDDKYYTINGKKELLELLGDRKKEIQQYMKKNKLNMRRDKDRVLALVGAFYDSITTK